MSQFRRTRLAAICAALSYSFAAAAQEQDPEQQIAAAVAAPAPEPADGIEDVIVTAQKRETNLQATPISISVLDSDALADRHVISLADLGDGAIPSLRVAPFFARSSALAIGMRGIGAMSDANQPARDQGVGVYVDGVYLGRAQGLGTALYDVERIEVLKGPQGTLFGRNTEGGAISIVTKKPSGEFHLNSSFGLGNYGGAHSDVHLDLPRFHDINVKIDGLMARRDGTVENPLQGQPDFNSYDKRGLRAAALWKPLDGFEATYAYDVSRDATTPYYVQSLEAGSVPRAPLMSLQPERAETANIGSPLEPSVGETDGHLLTLAWSLAEHLEIKSIGAYRSLKQSQFDNGAVNLSAFAPNGLFSRYSLAQVDQHQYSEELQLIGSSAQLQYVVGAFLFHEKVGDNAQSPQTLRWNDDGTAYTVVSLPPLDQIRVDRASRVKTDSLGLFGQATWTPAMLDSRLHLTAGGRWSKDEKKGVLTTVNGAEPTVCEAGGACVTGPVSFDDSWNRFDPMINLAYDLSDSALVYGKWSTGYKAGGANSRSLTYRSFDPEEVSAFELGTKTQFWDNRARFNLALYTASLKDMQVDFSADLIPPNTRTTLETVNAQGKGKSKGVEADFMLMPLRGLTLTLGYAYTDVSQEQASNPFAAGNPLVPVLPLYTPENAGSVAVDYVVPLASVILKAHLDGNWADGYYTSTTDPTLSDDSFIVNGRLALGEISLGQTGGTAEFALWSRNLLDEEHAFLKNHSAALGTYAIFNEPRTFGADAIIRF